MKRNIREIKFKFVHDDAMQNTNFVAEGPLDLVRYEFVSVEGKPTICKKCNDIAILFNQERLEKVLGKDNINKFIESLNNEGSESPFKDFTDDELLQFCKSRYIQKMSDLKAWSQYLMSEAVSIKNQGRQIYEKAIENANAVDHATSSNTGGNISPTSGNTASK